DSSPMVKIAKPLSLSDVICIYAIIRLLPQDLRLVWFVGFNTTFSKTFDIRSNMKLTKSGGQSTSLKGDKGD
ncbi:7698_t:CDS:2, partial [Funneliformis mosseae]